MRSPVFPSCSPTRSPAVLGRSLGALLLCAVAGCSSAADSFAPVAEGDASFGRGAGNLPMDAGANASADAGKEPPVRAGLRVRLVQGVLNLGKLHVCYDPDFVADNPLTSANEEDPGPQPATPLQLTAGVGAASTYVTTEPAASGALTIHREPTVVAPPSDAGVMPTDAGMLSDAAVDDAGATDASVDLDAGLADAGADGGAMLADLCDRATREAVVPLPLSPSMLDPLSPPSDASWAERGVVRTLEEDTTITMLGSGLVLDANTLEVRANAAREAYLATQKDPAGAERAALLEKAVLQAAFGPQFLLARETTTPASGRVELAIAHLVPDVAGNNATGDLRACITAGTVEGDSLPAAPSTGYPFRYRTNVASDLDPNLEYRIRVFGSQMLGAKDKDCATTSAGPIAELSIPRGRLQPGHSYTLAVVGAIAPASLCAPPNVGALVRAGCEVPTEQLTARILLLDDAP